MASCVAVCLFVSVALGAREPLQSDEPAPRAAASDAAAVDRETLLAHESERPARMNAALNLLASDPIGLADVLTTSTSDEVVLSILEALRIRAASTPAGDGLIAAVLERAASRVDGVAADARETLRVLDAAAREAIRPRLLDALTGEDPALARAAIDVLARSGDLAVVEPLLGVLERGGRDGVLSGEAAQALSELLGKRLGPDVAAWRAFWKDCVGKSRARILRDLLEHERTEHVAELDRKDREIVRLKREQDGADAPALIANLEHEIAGVRRFSAELLARGFHEVDLQGVRPVVLARLRSGLEPPAGQAAFLRLLAEIDVRGGRTDADPDRGPLVAQALSSASPEVVLAGIDAAQALPGPPAREAVLESLLRMRERQLPVAARLALVEAAAPSKLDLRDAVEALRQCLRHDESVDVRVACVSTLGALKSVDATADLTHALAKDADWRVRRRAASAVAAVAGAQALEPLRAAIEDARPEVRSEAASALAEVGDATAAGALLERLGREESPAVKAAIARALGHLRAPAALEPLTALLQSPVAAENGGGPEAAAAVRTDVRAALASIAGDDATRWETIAERVGDAAPDLVALARQRRFELLEAAGVPPAERVRARLEACRAWAAVGDAEKVANLADAAGAPEAGADAASHAEIWALEGRARIALGEATAGVAALRRAIAAQGAGAEHRFVWSLDLAEALAEAGDPKAAAAALPAGPAPAGVAAPDVERRDALRVKLGATDGTEETAPASTPPAGPAGSVHPGGPADPSDLAAPADSGSARSGTDGAPLSSEEPRPSKSTAPRREGRAG